MLLNLGELTEEQVKAFREAVEKGDSDNGTGLPDDMTDEEVKDLMAFYRDEKEESEFIKEITYDCWRKGKIEKWLYCGDSECRYVLGKYGERPLICFGINPSEARVKIENSSNNVYEVRLDPTIGKVINISSELGYDGFIMLNLYSLVDKDPVALKEKTIEEDRIKENLRIIRQLIEAFDISDTLWACWGKSIENDAYLVNSLVQINNLVKELGANRKLEWRTIKWTKTKPSHPYHPRPLRNAEIKDGCWSETIDMDKYINALKRR